MPGSAVPRLPSVNQIRTPPVDATAVGTFQEGGSGIPPARFSSTVQPEPVQGPWADVKGHSNSERGSNAANSGRLITKPHWYHKVLRDVEHPICSDPGPGVKLHNERQLQQLDQVIFCGL